METTPRINGFVAPGFEAVRTEFARNFAERGEIGVRRPGASWTCTFTRRGPRDIGGRVMS